MIIARSPLRVSFFGGGTDYPEHFLKEGGAVLATAIDKYLYVTASPFLSRLFDYSIRLSYRKVELVRHPHEIEHRVFRECLKLCELEKDIELQTMADLPAFTGLGSSSSFTVALLHAIHCFKGEFLTPRELACEAIHVERHLLRENVGCQDQVMAAFGGFNLVEFRSEHDFEVQRIPVTPDCVGRLEQHLLLVFTGIKRKASDVVAGQLAKRSCNAETLRRMQDMVYQGFKILTSGRQLHDFGELLHHAWLAKHSLDGGISNPGIDELYERGRKAGAIGGKLLGAGGGGFMLFFVPLAARPKLQKTFRNWQTLAVRLNAPGSQIIFS
jgi:D-glycero-alpha-D-manno-heptose-7-phosphate kinase